MVHELAYGECPKSYVFRGNKDYQPKQIADMLGLNPSSRPMQAPRPGQPLPAPAASKFLMPVQACEFQLTSILEGLSRDPWPVEQDKRPLRCTGVALGVAVALLEVSQYFPSVADDIVRVPRYWCQDHAVCRRSSHRRTGHGRLVSTARTHPISPRH